MEIEKLWTECLKIINEKLEGKSYFTWILPIIPVKYEENDLVLQVPSHFFYEQIEEHYAKLIYSALMQITGKNITINYRVFSGINMKKPHNAIQHDRATDAEKESKKSADYIVLNSITWEEFYKRCKPEGLMIQYSKVIHVDNSIEKERFTLKEINEIYGNIKFKNNGECDSGILYLYGWLNFLNALSNINKPLPSEAIKSLSIILYSKYDFFYLSDLKLILEGILEGKYGKFFGSVDSQLIMTAFSDYKKERDYAINKMNQKK